MAKARNALEPLRDLAAIVRQWPDGQNLQPLFHSLYGSISPRQQRLAALAMCRRIAWAFPDPACNDILATVERYADGAANRSELNSAHRAAIEAWGPIRDVMFTRLEDAARYAVRALILLTHPTKRQFADNCAASAGCREPTRYSELHREECRAQKALLLDVLPPLRFAEEQNRRAGRYGDLPARLARGLHHDRALDQLAVLADALEEVGCTDAELLDHLRSPGPHIPGCWALDLLAGW